MIEKQRGEKKRKQTKLTLFVVCHFTVGRSWLEVVTKLQLSLPIAFSDLSFATNPLLKASALCTRHVNLFPLSSLLSLLFFFFWISRISTKKSKLGVVHIILKRKKR